MSSQGFSGKNEFTSENHLEQEASDDYKTDHYRFLDRKRNRISKIINNVYNLIRILPDVEDEFIGEAKEIIEEYQELKKIYDQISILNLTGQESSILDKDYYETREKYVAIRRVYEKLTISSSAYNFSNNEKNSCQLPEIKIKPFRGEFVKFPAFIAIYDAVIHNASIPDVIKFVHLKGLIEGQAEEMINSIEFKPENYIKAYNRLVDFYNDPRKLSFCYYKKMHDIKPIRRDAMANRLQLVNAFSGNFRALQRLQGDKLGEFMALQMAYRVLDKEDILIFQQNVDKPNPSLKDLIEFIDNLIMANQLANI